jgi:predicted nucleic acid-binding protein
MSAQAAFSHYVLDSWAVLAWLRNEPSAGRVRAILEQAEERSSYPHMSWINAGEVYYVLVRKHGEKAAEEFLARLPSLPIRLVLPSEETVILAARLKSNRRIAYADGFAAALAQQGNATLVTGDPELRELSDVLTVEWIGERQTE